jgi:acetoin utilization protein AcuB
MGVTHLKAGDDKMKVRRRMQTKIFTIQKDEPVEKAQTLMAMHNIRHLPVLDGNRLVGILSDRDVRGVLIPHRLSGSKTCQSAFYLPRDVMVEEAMSSDPLSVAPGSDIEEAARILMKHKIGCLPVIEGDKVVGIITDTDILWVFCEIMGVLESSSRIDITLGTDPQAMEKATEIIRKNHGRIISVGVHPNSGKRKKIYSFRLKSCDTGPIVAGLEKAGYKVQDEVG